MRRFDGRCFSRTTKEVETVHGLPSVVQVTPLVVTTVSEAFFRKSADESGRR